VVRESNTAVFLIGASFKETFDQIPKNWETSTENTETHVLNKWKSQSPSAIGHVREEPEDTVHESWQENGAGDALSRLFGRNASGELCLTVDFAEHVTSDVTPLGIENKKSYVFRIQIV